MATDKLSIKFPKWMKIKGMSETEGICDFLKGKSRSRINFKRLTLNTVRVWSNGLLLAQIPYSCLSVPEDQAMPPLSFSSLEQRVKKASYSVALQPFASDVSL